MEILAGLLSLAIQATPASIETARPLVEADIKAATAALESGRLDDSFAAAERAIAAARPYAKIDPVLLSDALVARCDAASNRSEPDISDCREALALREAALTSDDPKLHNLRIQIAVNKIMTGHAAEAQADIETALAGLRRGVQTSAMRTDVGMGLAVLGMSQQAQDRRAEAELTYRAAITELGEADETGRRYRPMVYNYLNIMLLSEGRLVEALRDSETAVAIQRASAPVGDPTLIGALRALAAAQQRAGHLKAAEASLREQLALIDAQQSPQPSLRGNALSGLASLYIDTGRPDLARPLLERAITTYRQGGDTGRRTATTAVGQLADLDLQAGNPRAAVAHLEAALGDLGTEASGSQGRAALLTQLANALQAAGDSEMAHAKASEALEIYRRISPTAPVLSGPLLVLARADVATGRKNDAAIVLDEAVALARPRPASAPTRIAAYNARVDLALDPPGNPDAAIAAVADDAANGARSLLVSSARAGVSTRGLQDLTRTAMLNQIEVEWRSDAEIRMP